MSKPWPEKVPAPRHDANGADITNIVQISKPWPEKVPAPRHDANGVDVTNIA